MSDYNCSLANNKLKLILTTFLDNTKDSSTLNEWRVRHSIDMITGLICSIVVFLFNIALSALQRVSSI